MSYYPEFANFIENHLAEQDRSASWLASRLQANPATIGRWLNDRTRPGSPETVARIADILLIEKTVLLNAAGYNDQDAPDVTNQTATENGPNSNTESPNQKKIVGGTHFYMHASLVINGDVITDSVVHKTTYYNAEDVAIRKDIEENVQDEQATEKI